MRKLQVWNHLEFHQPRDSWSASLQCCTLCFPIEMLLNTFLFSLEFLSGSISFGKAVTHYRPVKNQNELETWKEQERRILERKRRNILCFWLEREFWNHPSIFLLSCCYSCFNLATTTDTYKERNRMTLRQERMGKREQTC